MAARNDYERYLEKKWAGVGISEYALKAAVENVAEDKVASVERWVRSYANEVYAVDTKSGAELVVRISRRGEGHFDGERWARTRCAMVGVPVPEMFGVVTRRAGDEVLSISVEQRVPGQTLDILWAEATLDGNLRRKLLADAGELLARIHTVPTDGWGRIDGSGHADDAVSFDEFRTKMASLRSVFRRNRLAFRHIDRALDVLEEDASSRSDPCLTHGDFGPKHIVIDRGEIVAVLDFEEAGGGTPYDDLGFWLYDNDEGLDAKALLTGYRRVSVLEEFKRHLIVARLGIGIGYFYGYGDVAEADMPEGFFSSVVRALRRDLAALDALR